MPILLTCPNGHKLSVAEEHAGKKAQCSVCKAIVPIPKPKPPRPVQEAIMPMEIEDVREPAAMMVTDIEDEVAMEPVLDYGDEDYVEVVETGDEDLRRKKKKSKDRALKRAKKRMRARIQGVRIVNLGLGFHYAWHLGFLGVFLLAIIILIAVYMAFVTRSIGGLQVAKFLGLLLLIDGAVVMPLLGLVGSILCIWVPAEAKGRPLIIVSLALNAALIPMMPLYFLVNLGLAGYYVIFGLTAVLDIGAWVMFMLFAKTVSEYLDEWALSREAVDSIFRGIIYLVGTVVVYFIFQLIMKAVAPMMQYQVTYIVFLLVGGLLIFGWIAWLWVLAKFVMTVMQMIASLRQVIYSRF